MIKYYTRACNFFYGKKAEKLILKNKALPLNASKNFAFDTIEIIKRNNKKVNFKIIKTSEIKKLSKNILKNVNKDLKRICKKKIFLGQSYSKGPFLMGVLNVTPDSFSDGGLFFNERKAINHVKFLIESGSNVIDVGGESTRPGSKVIGEKNEWALSKAELKYRKFTKRQAVAAQEIAVGTKLDLKDIVFKRTHEKGLSHKDLEKYIGRRFARPKNTDDPLTPEDFVWS